MASPASSFRTCTLNINVFDGARTPLPAGTQFLLTIRDGNQHIVALRGNGFFDQPDIRVTDLPFFDNFGDQYAVIASADNRYQAGFYPVAVNPMSPAVVDLMLLKRDAQYNFHDARWDLLQQQHSDYADLLRSGANDDAAAADRYDELRENNMPALACFFNLVTAMSQIQLPDQTPMHYIRELIWDKMEQDRFYAWCDPKLIDQVMLAQAHGEFAPEFGTAIFHSGATRSWKQVQFGEANVQLTFHENDRQNIGGVNCVMVEPDIDYYKDPVAHSLLEVVPNSASGSLSDPKQVYVLRWMAGRHAGVPNFDPPYTLE